MLFRRSSCCALVVVVSILGVLSAASAATVTPRRPPLTGPHLRTTAIHPNRWRFLLRNSTTAGNPDIDLKYGNPTLGDIPVTGDWNGDGKATIGVIRVDSKTGHLNWLLRNTNTVGNPDIQFAYGNANLNDIPVIGDWDGDGSDTIGVVRPDPDTDSLTWLLRNTNSAGSPDITFTFGSAASGDEPGSGDWDGNKTDTPGIVRPNVANSHLTWMLSNATSSSIFATIEYGNADLFDAPVSGDWDGNKTTTIGVVRPDGSTGHLNWLLRNTNSAGGPDIAFAYGNARLGDVPVTGDWDGDSVHSETVGVVRPTT
jgi:hypothetical protein